MTVTVFARRPEKGRVKTRLARVLGDEAALDLHRAFLADTLTNARATGRRVVLARTPGPPCPEDALADEVVQQRGSTFGERFDHVLEEVAERHPGPLVLIGSDTPQLGSDAIQAAFEALHAAPLVVGPAPRGGFHLIGFHRPIPVRTVFDEDDEVAALETLAGPNGLHLLPPCRDLDEVEDLYALQEAPPLTRQALARWLPEARRPPSLSEEPWTERHTGN